MAEQQQDVRYIVRVMDTDIDGTKPVFIAMRKIKGVSFMYANMVLQLAHIDKTKKAGILNPTELQKIEDVMKNPLKYGAPVWMLNRRRDMETDADLHLIGSDIDFVQGNDIKLLKRIKAYRGIRHMHGQPVRGQRTRSNFRKNKGKGSLGVQRKKVGAPADDKKK